MDVKKTRNRAKKGGKITFYLPTELQEDLKKVSILTGTTSSRLVQEAIKTLVTPYRNNEGEIVPVPAILLPDPVDASYRAAAGETDKDLERDCFVLCPTTMMGQAYYAIYLPGEKETILKVPAERIQFPKK